MQIIRTIAVSFSVLATPFAVSASDTLQLRLAVTNVMAAGILNDGFSDYSQVDVRVKKEKENPMLKPFAPQLVPTNENDVLGFKLVLTKVGGGDCETLSHASLWLDDISRVVIDGRDVAQGTPECQGNDIVEIHYH